MKLRGLVTLEFVNQETGEVRTEQRENFFHGDQINRLFYNSEYLGRVAILGANEDVFPYKNRYSSYYDSERFLVGQESGGIPLKRFVPKTTESPAYIEFYSMFLPDDRTRLIPAIGIVRSNDSLTPKYTAINLNPPCLQEPTEYLNIYYRVILQEDPKDTENSDYIRELFLQDTSYQKVLFNTGNKYFSAFRINQDLGKSGWVNLLVLDDKKAYNGNIVYPRALNDSLQYAQKNEYVPQAAPDQYNQLMGEYLNTIIRGGSGNSNAINGLIGVHPFKFVPETGSGVGNVFATNAKSDSKYFDPANFPVGSGKMFASGQWEGRQDKNAFPSRFQVTITKTAKNVADMEYRVYEFHDSPKERSPFIPTSLDEQTFNNIKANIYSKPDNFHLDYTRYGLCAYQENRSMIFFNRTGITIYDFYNGTLTPFDANSNPPVPVTDLRNVRVDIKGNIWMACAATGLWMLKIDEATNTTTLKQIGTPPGCQPRVFAIDTDNFGNLFAIWWGLGLHYTSDEGDTWVNAIINYADFSEYDQGGLDSKWRFVNRIVVNPHRDAKVGNAQILLLQRRDENTGSMTAGCWYDQISATTTGITNSEMRSSLDLIRNNPHIVSPIVVSKRHDKWMWLNNIFQSTMRTSAIDGQTRSMYKEINYVPFQHNAAPSSMYGFQVWRQYAYNNLKLIESWSDRKAAVTEKIVAPFSSGGGNNPACFCEVFDVELDESLIRRLNDSKYSISSDQSNVVFIGPNRMFYLGAHYDQSTLLHVQGFRPITDTTNDAREWVATFWGWNGSKWEKDFYGSRKGHTVYEPVVKGLSVAWKDGNAGTTSFVATDKYTVTCFDGLFKDNSSKLYIRDTVYIKGRETITDFTPSVVTLVDKTAQVGLMASANINVDWNIDNLPSTKYEGSPTVTDGDDDYNNVVALLPLNEQDIRDRSIQKATPTVTGTVTVSGVNQLTHLGGAKVDTAFFNGRSGITFTGNQYVLGQEQFTIELWVSPSSFPKTSLNQILVDLRNSDDSEAGYLGINKLGQAVFWDGTSEKGGVGAPLALNQWSHIALSRKARNEWELAVNGFVLATWIQNITFTTPKRLNVGKRFAVLNAWNAANPTVVEGPITGREAFGVGGYARYTPEIDLQAGDYCFSVYVKARTNYGDSITVEAEGQTYNLSYLKSSDSLIGNGSRELLTDGWVRLVMPFKVTTPTKARLSMEGVAFSCPMLNKGNTAKPYADSGESEDQLIPYDSNLLAGSVLGYHGYMSDLRITVSKSRYNGNLSLPTEPFKTYSNNYGGWRLKLSNTHHQGSIIGKRELVGNWSVVFSYFDENLFKHRKQRPSLFFGVTSASYISNLTDIGYRIGASVQDGKPVYQTWMQEWKLGQTLESAFAFRIRKDLTSNKIITEYKPKVTSAVWVKLEEVTDYAGIHYIAFWQESVALDDNVDPIICPLVNVEYNGADYVSKVGSAREANGAYHRKFLAVDNYHDTDFRIQLDGKLATNHRSNYQNEAAPLAGEVYVHQHGTVRFHAADVGKTITGKATTIHD
jgi:hypothetical protein|nr:MAG TPA: Extracellular arabinanase, arabinanase, arabinotriose, Geobacillus stearothermophilus [Caudoviricetes sp.]